MGGYSKEVCFRDAANVNSKEQIKRWYYEQKKAGNFGRGCNRLISRWKKSNIQEVENFLKEFDKSLKYCEKIIQKNRQN